MGRLLIQLGIEVDVPVCSHPKKAEPNDQTTEQRWAFFVVCRVVILLQEFHSRAYVRYIIEVIEYR